MRCKKPQEDTRTDVAKDELHVGGLGVLEKLDGKDTSEPSSGTFRWERDASIRESDTSAREEEMNDERPYQ